MQFNIPAEHKNASGVYIIRNTVNNKVYVGSAKNFRIRYNVHCHSIRKSCHHSVLLQRFVDKYGFETLRIEVLELCPNDKASLISCEQKWLDSLAAANPETGFNHSPTASSRAGCKGKPWDNAHRNAVMSSIVGRVKSPEERAKLSAALKGRPVSDKRKKELSAKLKGRKVSPEALANRPKEFSPEHRAAISAAQKGRTKPPYAEGHKKKLAALLMGYRTPEMEEKRLAGLRAHFAAKRLASGD